MKRRTLITIIILLSMVLSAIPVRAASIRRESAPDFKESAQHSVSFNTSLADFINTLPEAHHDAFDGQQSPFFCRAEGWAADPDDRSLDLNVRVFSDGVEIAQTVADTFRQDLADAGVCGDGTCSFSLSLWGLISPDVDHLILMQSQDAQTGEWVTSYDTPKTLNCFTPQGRTLLVNSTADGADANPGDLVCETYTPGECTLRAAIQEANANPGTDAINFNIPGAGPYTISPSYGLDFINDPVIIDGTTQPGFTGTPIIELDGSSAGAGTGGLTIVAGSSTVRGLIINRFDGYGIRLDTNGGDIIQGNYVGVDVSGSLSLGNAGDGVVVGAGADNSLIGGEIVGARNLISGNGGNGVSLFDGVTGNSVRGNFIGTDASGTFGLGNSGNGVVIAGSTPGNLIGTGNVISGNAGFGIVIVDAGSSGNLVQGNYIGTNSVGDAAVANLQGGVGIFGEASQNTVGGTTADVRNVISGNSAIGVTIADPGTTGNVVEGNFIGTDATGTLALGNRDDGVVLDASDNTIGGTIPGARNIISGNEEQGVRLQGPNAHGNVVEGNFIGTDVTGTLALGNGTDCCHSGVVLHLGANHNTVGGDVPGAGNVISGNTADGVTLMDAGTTGNVVAGNYIGTDLTGTRNLANAFNGIDIFDGASDNMLGQTTTGAGNTIAFNNDNGVILAMSSGARNGISSNSIYSNGNLGIDLGQDGVTGIDLFDLDRGPNNLQNAPVITMVKSSSKGTVIQGVLISNVNTTFRLELFSSNSCDPSGYGEGQTYLGSAMMKTNTTGHINFRVTLPVSLIVGNFVTATATDPANNTSEFSDCTRVSS